MGVPSEARPPAPTGDQPEPRGNPRLEVDTTRHCPYLGLRNDPATYALYPTANHCCFARRRPWQVPHYQQVAFCLAQFERCTIYTAARSLGEGKRTVRAHATVTQRLRQWLWVSLLITLLVAIGAYAVAHALARHATAVSAIVLVCSALAFVVSLALLAALAAWLSRR